MHFLLKKVPRAKARGTFCPSGANGFSRNLRYGNFGRTRRLLPVGLVAFPAAAGFPKAAMAALAVFARVPFALSADDNGAGEFRRLPAVFGERVISVVWTISKSERRAAGRAALLLALLLCGAAPFGTSGVTALAAGGETSARMLVPVGHTVGIKLFARGVLVVKLTDGGTPARDCGLQTGDVIVKCGGTSVTSTEQFQSLLQENGGGRHGSADPPGR